MVSLGFDARSSIRQLWLGLRHNLARLRRYQPAQWHVLVRRRMCCTPSIWQSVFCLLYLISHATTLFVLLDHQQSYCKNRCQAEETACDAYAGLRSCAETGASTLIRTFV
jgi:hypothetical protein